MGLFDKFKSVLGGADSKQTEIVKGPTRVLKDAGIDTSSIKCQIQGDGKIRVSGSVGSGEERDRVVSLLGDMPNVSGVINELNVEQPAEPAEPATSEPAAGTVEAPVEAPAEAAGERKYTVQSGDTLWKISQEMYGSGAKYMKIFEANKGLLENPDKIFPGQELTIPELED